MKIVSLGLILFITACNSLKAQKDDILFSIQNNPVYVSEFAYIYEKNNRENADYSKKSLDEYLNLYINFKLKVQKAKDLGYHNTDSYKAELEGYRRQLVSNYMLDREVVAKLAEEMYERSRTDLHLAHILIGLESNADDKEVTERLNTLKAIQQEISEGLSFEKAAGLYSEDVNSSQIGGDISYITAGLPEEFEELEDAAYLLKEGEISNAVRSPMGFHLLKLLGKRPARGSIELAHILMRDSKNGIPLAAVDAKLSSLKQDIEEGKIAFEEAASLYSEDQKTRSKQGYLGFVQTSEYETDFEDAAYALSSDNQISDPVKTSFGWHLIKRISKPDLPGIEGLKERIKSAPVKSNKYLRLRSALIKRIQQEAGYTLDNKVFNEFKSTLDSSFFDYDWSPRKLPDLTLIQLGKERHGISSFVDFAKATSRARLRAKGQTSLKELADELLEQFQESVTLQYAENNLESRYVDFKNLMREYEEGILLFEITKNEVWDKAVSDTSGLAKFYEQNKDNYRWEERAIVNTYTIRTADPNMIADILTKIKSGTHESVLAKYNVSSEMITFKTDIYDRTSEILRGMPFKNGVTSSPKFNPDLNITTILKIEEILASSAKSLSEAKGYVISDYQDYLEKNWISELNNEYKVFIDKKALNALVRNE